jgi:hypothetical protein
MQLGNRPVRVVSSVAPGWMATGGCDGQTAQGRRDGQAERRRPTIRREVEAKVELGPAESAVARSPRQRPDPSHNITAKMGSGCPGPDLASSSSVQSAVHSNAPPQSAPYDARKKANGAASSRSHAPAGTRGAGPRSAGGGSAASTTDLVAVPPPPPLPLLPTALGAWRLMPAGSDI